ncbi:PD-(D/E)XK motif protein [Treponema sp.]|uniref:PD-(D/E)XK motif protein n=1 Tax=Treponema sp. TaxID=166 RepID=UPI002592A876|nr:PD-(D/E)XK motif protein [uncultured Treponema sp.]
MIKDEIKTLWSRLPKNSTATIKSLVDIGYKTWALRFENSYGVAIPVDSKIEIAEDFSGAKFFTGTITVKENEKQSSTYVLILAAESPDYIMPFSALCEEFVSPGTDGTFRKSITEKPEIWWKQWKELLGNKNTDERTYATLGELITYKYLLKSGAKVVWNGPEAATYDLDCSDYYCEVKSSTARNKRQITLSNLFQLTPPNGKKLFLVFCQFEESQKGISINSVLEELVLLGCDRNGIEDKLQKVGLQKGKSSRNNQYIIHSVNKYVVDENFPAIRESSFLNGTLPKGVISLTYVVSLDSITGENITEKVE